MKHLPKIFILVIALSLAIAGTAKCEEDISKSLSPQYWPEHELDKYTYRGMLFDFENPLVKAESAMVAGTSGPLAIHSGVIALKRGGNAADAAVTTALAQVVLSGGSWNSYAGTFYMVYYNARTGTVSALNAGYNTVLAETQPLTIPKRPKASGRTALVPGFMAGIEAAHKRYGVLPFERVFEPAIYFAEKGFPVDAMLQSLMDYRWQVLTRRPDTSAIFCRPDGKFYRKGDIFRQPKLAVTLRRVAQRGADYMYSGKWAEKFIAAIKSEGGKMTLDDLARYEAKWGESTSTHYYENDIYTLGLPEQGAVQLIEALNILECADHKTKGHYAKSADALHELVQVSRLGQIVSYSASYDPYNEDPTDEFAPRNRVKMEAALAYLERLQNPNWEPILYTELKEQGGGHSDGIVVVDRKGNVAVVLHSSHTTAWGETGIFVDGVSIPDTASFQQYMLSKVKPGKRFPSLANPVIVIRGGKPVFATVCIGTTLHENMLQNLVNVLDFGMNPKQAVGQPHFLGPGWMITTNKDDLKKQCVVKGSFSRELIEETTKKGQPFIELLPVKATDKICHWLGITIHPANRALQGAVSRKLNGIVDGY